MYFKMEPGKSGRLKYLIMTLLPAYLFTKGIGRLSAIGILPDGQMTGFLTMTLSLALMGTLGYFLVFRKNHIIEVSDLSVAERDWRGACRVIPLGKITHYKRNLLNEILLQDENGKTLLCVESNMENMEQFEKWLAAHQIGQTEKETIK